MSEKRSRWTAPPCRLSLSSSPPTHPSIHHASSLFFFSTLHDSTITFFQQVGFASLELGSVRAKNTRNILLKVRQMKKKERE